MFGGLIEFYVGAYGPTLRIECDTVQSLIGFHRMLTLLCSDLQDSVCLTPNDRLVLNGISALEMRRRPKRAGGPTLQIVNGRALWRQTSDDWCDTAGLIKPLVADPTGYQYLLNDDTIVELIVRVDERT